MSDVTAAILTIGDELLIGQVVNSNAAWIGEKLTGAGVDVRRMTTVGDDENEIRRFVRTSLEDCHIVICTGGLGPTHDDITRDAVAREFGLALQFREDLFEGIKERFRKRQRSMPEAVRSQAQVPEGFHAEPNPSGTAPGLVRLWKEDGKERLLALLPGVPHEMKELIDLCVMPRISELRGNGVIRQKTLLTTGTGESNLHEMLDGLDKRLGAGLSLAFLPNLNGVRLRLTARGSDASTANARIAKLEEWIRDRVGTLIYGEGDDSLEGVVGEMLADRSLTIAVAESCTGGLLGSRITDVPGASGYFRGGVVSYSNDAKETVLLVSSDTLESDGAVSRRAAIEMAEGVRDRLGADIGLATTGIMGPGGGSDEKPVGTLWMGLADSDGTRALHVQLGSERGRNKQRASTAALNFVRLYLMKRSGKQPDIDRATNH